MAWTFCTSGSAINKAGTKANSTIIASGSALATWSDEIEGIICSIARKDLVSQYSSLTANGKTILGSIASAYIAQQIVSYDVLAYSQLRHGELMLDKLENEVRRGLSEIEDDKIKTYLAVS